MRRPIAYEPGSSWLHRLHPLVKGAWLLGLSVLTFTTRAVPVVLGVLTVALAALALSGLSLRNRRGAVLLVLTSIGLGVVQILFQTDGAVLIYLGPVTVTRLGLMNALYVAGRFLGVVLLSYGYVLSTNPNDLAYSLMRAGLPYRYGFALVTALRLVPLFEQEAETVYNAQLARGIGHDAHQQRLKLPLHLLTQARQLLFPVLSSALGKVDALAVSMEGRGFGRYPTRTFLRTVPFTRGDRLALLLLALVILPAIPMII
ncbi:MAG: energy-coupling factor transporter transmembrane protein EcfT [Anaerolineae bacterium]|nr:energy-coupling factor transporter transmembrane protein EcfT [Anaerolineae bacterium]